MLKGALTTLEGRISDMKEMGTHTVLFLEVEAITTQDKDALMYFDRQFKHLQADVKVAEVA